ncbi:MAG: hypothetical protein R3Y47_13070 [Lachnospiraceae bacterium]
MRVESFCAKALALATSIIFLVLTYQAICFTHVDSEGWLEPLVKMSDNIVVNIVVSFAIIMIACFLADRLARLKGISVYVALVVLCVFSVVLGMVYVSGHSFLPTADQAYILEAAILYEMGDFSFLEPVYGYVGICPHQKGLVVLYIILSKIFGCINYRHFQYLNIGMLPLLIISGFFIVKILGEKKKSYLWMYLFGIATCIPMYLYVPYAYGETISTALALFSIGWYFQP